MNGLQTLIVCGVKRGGKIKKQVRYLLSCAFVGAESKTVLQSGDLNREHHPGGKKKIGV